LPKYGGISERLDLTIRGVNHDRVANSSAVFLYLHAGVREANRRHNQERVPAVA
jgi:hypothetical protein